jgi:hypothetical protein
MSSRNDSTQLYSRSETSFSTPFDIGSENGKQLIFAEAIHSQQIEKDSVENSERKKFSSNQLRKNAKTDFTRWSWKTKQNSRSSSTNGSRSITEVHKWTTVSIVGMKSNGKESRRTLRESIVPKLADENIRDGERSEPLSVSIAESNSKRSETGRTDIVLKNAATKDNDKKLRR